MAFVSLQGGIIATKERLRKLHPMKAIQFTLHLQTYVSSSTISKCPEDNSHSARYLYIPYMWTWQLI